MRKLLLLIMISTAVLGCKKDKLPTKKCGCHKVTEKVQEEEGRKRPFPY